MADRTPRTLRAAELAAIECIALGVLPPELALGGPAAERLVLRDPEGVTVATWTARAWPNTGSGPVTGSVTIADPPTSPTYLSLRQPPTDVADAFAGRPTTAVVGVAPPADDTLADLLADASSSASATPARSVLFLAAAGGVRRDDAAHHRAIRAWQRASDQQGVPLVLCPLWADAPDEVRATVARAYGADRVIPASALAPAAAEGAVVLFTGLSGSGKSTIAAQLVAQLTETRGRTVTLLDGDVVRTHLSSELGFSPRDRDLNIRRIGWVAAEVAKHGGLAVAAPIAPYTQTRAAVRAMVEQQCGPGSFLLVHVSTPLAECERRDRKGLYAKARAGELADFTGISAPYETPEDAALSIDTTDVSAGEAAARVLACLEASGRL